MIATRVYSGSVTDTAIDEQAQVGIRERLPALLALALASGLAVTTEMLPVGLLPDIGASFGVSNSIAGLLVSLYAVMVAALSVPLTLATSRFGRKPLLLATVSGYAISNALVAAAPAFAVVAVGRTLGGMTHALFFSLVIGYTPRLVADGHVGRALAIAGSGASAGFVLGVPLLTSLGIAAGWRASFAVLVGLSAIAFVLVALLLPPVEHGAETAARPPGAGRMLAAVAASNALVFLGHFTVFTFVAVLLLTSGVAAVFVGPILLACGALGLVGLWCSGHGLDRNPRRTAVIIVTVMVGAVIAVGAGWPALVAVVVATAVWSGAFGGLPQIYQAGAVRARATSHELAGAWINASANVGIAAGSALGAGLLHVGGPGLLPWPGAALIVAGLVVILLAPKAFPRSPRATAQ